LEKAASRYRTLSGFNKNGGLSGFSSALSGHGEKEPDTQGATSLYPAQKITGAVSVKISISAGEPIVHGDRLTYVNPFQGFSNAKMGARTSVV
jgi:hypothetical protein